MDALMERADEIEEQFEELQERLDELVGSGPPAKRVRQTKLTPVQELRLIILSSSNVTCDLMVISRMLLNYNTISHVLSPLGEVPTGTLDDE